MRNGEVPLSRNPRIPSPSYVEAIVSYPQALFITHKGRSPLFYPAPRGGTL